MMLKQKEDGKEVGEGWVKLSTLKNAHNGDDFVQYWVGYVGCKSCGEEGGCGEKGAVVRREVGIK